MSTVKTARINGWKPSPAVILAATILTVAVAYAFAPALQGEFLNWDDDRNFLFNLNYRGVGWPQIRWACSTFHVGVWQPLAWMLLGLQYVWFGLTPKGYHFVSLVLHGLNVVMLYLVSMEILARTTSVHSEHRSVRTLCAAGAVLLFAVHPLRVETVGWLSCQPYLPSTLLYLVAVYVYLKGHDQAGRMARPVITLGSIILLYAAAVACKAVAISLPAVLLLLDAYPLGRWRGGWRDRLRLMAEKAPLFALGVIVAAWAVAAKDYGASRSPFHEFDFGARFAHASAGFWFLLGKTIVPINLIAYYRLPSEIGLHEPTYLLATVAALGISLVTLIARKRWPAMAAAWWSYLVILLPNLGLIHFSQQLSADRYSYLAIMGPTILLAGAMVRLSQGAVQFRKVLRYGMVLAIAGTAVILIYQTRAQTLMWRDSEMLWESTLAVDEKCAVAHCNLGEALLRRDQVAEASRHLSRAIDIDAKFAFAYANLGVVYCQARRFDDAVLCGQYAVSLQPGLSGMDLARVHAMLGEAYAGLRRDAEAWEHTRIAQKLGLVEAQKMIDYLSRLSPEPAQKTPSNSH